MVRDYAEHAIHLHRQAVVIDAHCDILMPIADGLVRLGQAFDLPDPALWISPVRAQDLDPGTGTSVFQTSLHTQTFGTAGQYSLPQLKQGGVTVQTCAIYIEDRHLDRTLQRGLEMTWWLHHEIESNPGFELVTQKGQIQRLKTEGKTGAILALEGFEAIGPDLRFLDLYYQLGLRMASLTHNRRNLFADGPQVGVNTGGLTVLGRQAVQRMNQIGIILDLVHTNEACFWEALELSQAPVVVSHLSPYAFQRWRGEDPQPGYNRQLDRPALEALARKGSVIGAIFFGHRTVPEVADNVLTLLELAGEDHVGLGSDLYGLDYAPSGLETIDRLPALTEELLKRGLSDTVILKILGGNMLRLFEQVWKE